MMIDDIPEAVREAEVKKRASGKSPLPLIIGGGLVLSAIAAGFFMLLNRPSNSISQEPESPKISEVDTISPATSATETIAETPTDETQTKQEAIDNVLGHLPYQEADRDDLVAITRDGRVKLNKAAAQKFQQMEADAKAQGINLAIISGFRSVEAQNHLFFGIKEQRVQNAAKRAEVSAPPGYSEHHTGYAIDLGDARVPTTHLSPKFENTAAFRWLEKNAAKYSFELSFPRDNPQGISYEPWHWRFVGDRDSLETFYKGRNL